MTPRTRLPDSISVKELAEHMEKRGKLQPQASSNATTGERRALLAQHSLAVKGPTNAAADLQPGEDVDGWSLMRCMEIDCYDKNPRIRTNPRYADIRASIESRGGLTEALSVTRRPGAGRYMCYFGGNTRLQIMQELWLETHDPRYEWIHVVVRPWVSESDVIAAHLAENENRGDITFWERGRGVALLKSELECELKRPLSLRELAERARGCGLKLHGATAANLLFAVDYLAPIGPHLTHESAGAIRSRFGCLEKLADAINLAPYVRKTAFDELIAEVATGINAVRDMDEPPRLTKPEVEMILSRMTAQFAALAQCVQAAVERALVAVAGAEGQLAFAEIHRLLTEPPKEAVPEATDGTGHAARMTPAGRAGTRFSRRLGDFAAAFKLSDCIRQDAGRRGGFSVEPLRMPSDASGEPERHGAHRLLVQLALSAEGGDGEADDPVVALLRHPASWSLTRSLIDAYHRACTEKPHTAEDN
ncbi:ParB family protein [Azoarcus sp. CIB]|uniref:ParB family protein n=1 Tax=Aromatoleum sp. (strain CIB) TaxID=198107 RepID=UPI001E4C6D57|nr:ParB family protein [Azoarcus sp. CIB]